MELIIRSGDTEILTAVSRTVVRCKRGLVRVQVGGVQHYIDIVTQVVIPPQTEFVVYNDGDETAIITM